MTNFKSILIDAGRKIQGSLQEAYNKKHAEIVDRSFDTGRQKEIKDLILIKKQEIKNLENEMETLDPYIDSNTKERLEKDFGVSLGYSCRKSVSIATTQMSMSIEKKNQEEFEIIWDRFINMIDLACGDKERRSVLLQFYSIDWKSLGIDVPCDLNIGNIQIVDGRIISDATKLLN